MLPAAANMVAASSLMSAGSSVRGGAEGIVLVIAGSVLEFSNSPKLTREAP